MITFDEAGNDHQAAACCGEKDSLGYADPSHPNTNEPGLFGPGGGRVGAVALSPFIKPGTKSDAAYNHYSDTQGLLANKWVKSGSATVMLTPFSLATFASELTAKEFTHGGTVTQSTLAGQKAVAVTYPDGSKLYVANTGTAYPLRFDATGSVGGRRDFSEYGTAFHITAPPNPM